MRPLAHVGGLVAVAVNRLLEDRIGSSFLSSGEYPSARSRDTAFAVAQIFSVTSQNFRCLQCSAAYPVQNASCNLMARLVLSGQVHKGVPTWMDGGVLSQTGTHYSRPFEVIETQEEE